jgi:hypothetical protein
MKNSYMALGAERVPNLGGAVTARSNQTWLASFRGGLPSKKLQVRNYTHGSTTFLWVCPPSGFVHTAGD